MKALPRFEHLAVAGPSRVLSVRRHGAGGLVFGSDGTVEAGSALPSGDSPVAFAVTGKRGLKFGEVTMSSTPAGAGNRLTIVGEQGTGREVVEVLVCKNGQSIGSDGETCEAARETYHYIDTDTIAVSCATGFVRNDAGDCVCPAGLVELNGRCVSQ